MSTSQTPIRIPPGRASVAQTPAPSAETSVKRIGFISTTRADAGIYAPLLRALAETNRFDVSFLAGGTHHADAFGNTSGLLAEIKGVRSIAVRHFVDGDEPVHVCETAGRAITEFSRAIAEERCDLVFALGDRTEMLAACLAATIHKIPIAHLHGGDVTEGAYDDACRHAITKLSHVHFPALPQHAERIVRMGEESWRVHSVGSLALDALVHFKPEPIESISRTVDLDFRSPTAVVLFHPETLSDMPAEHQIGELLAAINDTSLNLLFIGPNADVGRSAVDIAIREFASSRPNARIVRSLTQEKFWSCLAYAAALIGNSSSGIIEAASLRKPVVNIGDRQRGRLAPRNVLHAPLNRSAILSAIQTATAQRFAGSLSNLDNPYGDGKSAKRILSAIGALPGREALLHKKWAQVDKRN